VLLSVHLSIAGRVQAKKNPATPFP
jgi:hypothetical protein